MTTKAELEKENELLREMTRSGTTVSGCTFTGSATDAQCEAVKEIAIALGHAAQALRGTPALVINSGGESQGASK